VESAAQGMQVMGVLAPCANKFKQLIFISETGFPIFHATPAQWPSRHQERRETKRRKTPPNEPAENTKK